MVEKELDFLLATSSKYNHTGNYPVHMYCIHLIAEYTCTAYIKYQSTHVMYTSNNKVYKYCIQPVFSTNHTGNYSHICTAYIKYQSTHVLHTSNNRVHSTAYTTSSKYNHTGNYPVNCIQRVSSTTIKQYHVYHTVQRK